MPKKAYGFKGECFFNVDLNTVHYGNAILHSFSGIQ